VSDKKNIILVGYSGHGYVVADVALENKWNILGYTEKNELKYNPYNLIYKGFEMNDQFFSSQTDQIEYVIGIGNNFIREKVFNSILQNNKKISTLISPSATISNSVTLGKGIFVNKNVTINALAKVGENVLLNTGCIIEHECNIGDSVHIAAGAVLGGKVYIGKRSFIGANSFIKQGVIIGDDVIVGAGTVILQNIPDRKIVVGNPSRFIKNE